MLYELSYDDVTNLVYTIVYDKSTGETSYINSNSNSVLQEQYDVQITTRATLDQILEVTVEEILNE